MSTITARVRAVVDRILNGPSCLDCFSSLGYSEPFCWVCAGLLPPPAGKAEALRTKVTALRTQADSLEQQLDSLPVSQ
jgi:hypothetical protein